MRKSFHRSATAIVTGILWEQYSERLCIKYLYITCSQDAMRATYWPGG